MLAHLEIVIHLVALDSQIPVHLLAVEVGAIDAGELRLAADRQAAAAARSGDYETAKRIMQPLVQTPEASALLEQIDRKQENGHG